MAKPPYQKTKKKSNPIQDTDSKKESKLTFTPHLKKKFASHNFGNLYIRVTSNRNSEYYSIGKSLNERYWNDNKKEVRESHPEAETINQLIKDKLEQVKKEKQASIKKVPFQNKLSFMGYLSAELEHLVVRKKFGTYKKYKTTYFHLTTYLKSKQNKDLLFTDINVDFVRYFETYLLSKVRENTTKNYMNCVKKLYKQAVDSDLVVMVKDPFTFYENRKTHVEKKFLPKQDIDKIIATRFERSNPLFHTRNYFLFQYFGQGLRVRDLLTLRYINIAMGDGHIKFIQTKTKKPHIVFMKEYLVSILKDYLPQDSVNPIINHQYTISIEGGKIIHKNVTYTQIQSLYKEYKMKRLSIIVGDNERASDKASKEVTEFNEVRSRILSDMTDALTVLIFNYSKKHQSEFIFPILYNEDFKDVVFDENTNLSKFQYNQCEAKVAMYNKRLKQLGV